MIQPARVYLDHNATSPLRPEARAAVILALDTAGNPSSVHAEGRKARRIIEDARERVAALVGAPPENVVFTSGATEANNWVLAAEWKQLFIPKIEHEAILAPAQRSPANVIQISSDENGVSRIEELAETVLLTQKITRPSCAALQMANNETGALQPVLELAAFCREHNISVHTDAVQAAGRVPIDMEKLGVDTLSLSSHKIGGPAGVGALIFRDGIDLPPWIVGGGQERRRRSGTENVSGIAGFGAAAACALREVADIEKCRTLRDELEYNLKAITPQAEIMAAGTKRLPNTSCFSLPGTSAETLLIKLDLAGIAVSSGAACSSGKVSASHVLSAMRMRDELSRGAIRVSLGWNSSKSDIETFLRVWRRIENSDRRTAA